MEVKKAIIPQPIAETLQDIKSVPLQWASIPLGDHPALPNFNRSLAVTGFNLPDLGDKDQRAYITLKQILTDKLNGRVSAVVNCPIWEIMPHNWSLLREETDLQRAVEVDEQTIDDVTEEVLSIGKTYLKVEAVKYIRHLLTEKKAHLSDILRVYLQDYAQAKEQDLLNVFNS